MTDKGFVANYTICKFCGKEKSKTSKYIKISRCYSCLCKLRRAQKFKASIDDSRYVELYNSGKSLADIEELTGAFPKDVTKILLRNGVSTRKAGSKRTYELDETFFDDINTEEKAYFLGFMYADGYNCVKQNYAKLSLKYLDREILEKFSILLKSNKPLKIYKNSVMFNMESKHLSKALEAAGCMQAKTFKITFPEWLREDLVRHFVRGYFDGDGGIWLGCRKLRKDGSERTNPSFGFVGRKEFLCSIRQILHDKCGLSLVNVFAKCKDRNDISGLTYGGRNNLRKFSSYIYDNSTIYLARKFILSTSLLNEDVRKYNYPNK